MDVLNIIGPVVTAAASLGTGAFGYMLAKRKASGRVDTSDAGALWKEAHELREAYQKDIVRLNESLHQKSREVEVILSRLAQMDEALALKDKRISDLEAQLTAFRSGLATRDAQIAHLEAEVQGLQAALAGRDSQIATLKAENAQFELRVYELEQELKARLAAARTATGDH